MWNRSRSVIHQTEAAGRQRGIAGPTQGGRREEEAMTRTETLWLNGFRTASEMLANDTFAIEEVRQVLEGEESVCPPSWLTAWTAGLDAGVRASFGS
jgi:hypothetical protein